MREVRRARDDDRRRGRGAHEHGDVPGALDDPRGDGFQAGRVPAGKRRGDELRAPGVRRGVRQGIRLLRRELRLEVLDLFPQLPGVGLLALDRGGQLRGKDGQRPHASGHGVPQRTVAGQRAAAAEKRDARAAAEPLRRGDGDDPDRAGARHVCSAARRQIEVLDVDQAERAFARGFLAQRQRRDLVRPGEADRHRPVFPDDPVGLVFRARDLRRRQLAGEVDRRVVRAEVKTLRPGAQQAIERRRQHVLPRVLLHVIETARPVDLAADATGGRGAVHHVQNPPIVGLHDVDDSSAGERPQVERLPARRGVKRGAVEHDGRLPLMRRRLDDIGVERLQVRVVVIKTLSHHWVPGPLVPGPAVPGPSARGSIAPASLKPRARSTQLSQWPHGRPSGCGS